MPVSVLLSPASKIPFPGKRRQSTAETGSNGQANLRHFIQRTQWAYAGKPPRPGDFSGRVVHFRSKDADAAIEKASTLLKIDPERLMAARIAEKD